MTPLMRREEIAVGLRTVRGQIELAASHAGRDPAEVTLVVVTKTFPASDIRLLVELGVRDIAENRHPEAVAKAAELTGLDVSWHFVGQVQSNKAGRIAAYADVVHSADSSRVVHRLGAGAVQHDRTITCLVQVSLDLAAETMGRGGAAPDTVSGLAQVVAATEGLRFGGVMAVAPRGGDASRAFRRLARIAADLRHEHPAATMISAGMSGDFADAVRAGATHVRVGSAVLGRRAALR